VTAKSELNVALLQSSKHALVTGSNADAAESSNAGSGLEDTHH